MSDEYTSRFQSQYTQSPSVKPKCYGDIESYDSADPVCADCIVRRGCKVVVEKKLTAYAPSNRTQDASNSRAQDAPVATTRPTLPQIPPARREQIIAAKDRAVLVLENSFAAAFAYNASLVVVKAFFGELLFGLGSIPHVSYPNPLQALLAKKDPPK